MKTLTKKERLLKLVYTQSIYTIVEKREDTIEVLHRSDTYDDLLIELLKEDSIETVKELSKEGIKVLVIKEDIDLKTNQIWREENYGEVYIKDDNIYLQDNLVARELYELTLVGQGIEPSEEVIEVKDE